MLMRGLLWHFLPEKMDGEFSSYYLVLETFIILQIIDISSDKDIVQNQV